MWVEDLLDWKWNRVEEERRYNLFPFLAGWLAIFVATILTYTSTTDY